MRATLAGLDESWDLIVVGAGIHGAFAALEAARREIRVVLLDRGDIGGGTSANSLKIVHGGLRYLARADLARMRESIRERSALLRLAPHVVRPLPCAMPVSGRLRLSAAATALMLNDAAGRLLSEGSLTALPPSRVIGVDEMFALAEPAWWGDATAAALWHDALIEAPERIMTAVVREAVHHGASVRTYFRVDRLLRDGTGRVSGISGLDLDTGDRVEIPGRLVLNVAGASSARLLDGISAPPCLWADGWNVVLARAGPRAAVAVPLPRERRYLFAVPWRERLTVGTGYAPRQMTGAGDDAADGPSLPGGGAMRARAERLVADVSAVRPELGLSGNEIVLAHAGALPMERDLGERGVVLLDRARLIDHQREHGVAGVVTVIGVKWTTARRVAEKGVDACERRLRGTRRSRPSGVSGPLGAWMDVHGAAEGTLPPASARHVQSLYGPAAAEVIAIAAAEQRLAEPLAAGTPCVGAQVAHAIRKEGAVKLTDILMRRMDVATAGWPGSDVVLAAARIAAGELTWSVERMNHEIAEVRAQLAPENA